MKCWNCGKRIPDTAKACQYCEALVEEEPSPEEAAAVLELLERMDPEVISDMRRVFEESKDGEDFANRILVGPCPRCGSSDTGDCDADPEINDIRVGRCFECGQLWCCVCDQLFAKDQLHCRDCPAEEDES